MVDSTHDKDGAVSAPSYDVYKAVDIIARLLVICEGRTDRALAIVGLFKDQFDTYQALFNQLSHNYLQWPMNQKRG